MNTVGRFLISALFVACAALAYSGVLDDQGEVYAEKGLARALLAFGIARGLNGVISVAQGTEVAVQPAGIGVNFTPGQILDPINDLIERFSWIMLISSASLGIQKTLLTITSWPYFSYAVIALFSLAAVLVWSPPATRSIAGRYFLKFVLTLVFIRFAVSLVAITSEWVYSEFLQPQFEQATAELETATRNIGRLNQAATADVNEDTLSLLDKAKRFYDSATATFNVEARIEQYQVAAAEASRHAINLTVVFVFQTIVFPLIFLTLIYQVTKNLLWFGRRDSG